MHLTAARYLFRLEYKLTMEKIKFSEKQRLK